MSRTAKNVLLCGALAIVVLVMLGWSFGYAHSWYDGQCCNEQDCRQTVLREVERRDAGWFVVPTGELIPFDDERIKRSLDPLIHVCMRPKWTGAKKTGEAVRCLYVPEQGI